MCVSITFIQFSLMCTVSEHVCWTQTVLSTHTKLLFLSKKTKKNTVLSGGLLSVKGETFALTCICTYRIYFDKEKLLYMLRELIICEYFGDTVWGIESVLRFAFEMVFLHTNCPFVWWWWEMVKALVSFNFIFLFICNRIIYLEKQLVVTLSVVIARA